MNTDTQKVRLTHLCESVCIRGSKSRCLVDGRRDHRGDKPHGSLGRARAIDIESPFRCQYCERMIKLLGLCLLTFPVLALAIATALADEAAPGPWSPEKAVNGMQVPNGFKVTLVAAEPDVVQPISFCIDDRGRLFVAEALNYADWQKTGKDRITILEDTDGDGRADSRKVFFEGLNYVTGIEVGFGGVWAISPPNLYFIPDRDGDDVPDGKPKVLFDGFGHEESRHNLANGFTWGPDGWLYAGHGRTSPSDVGPPGTPADKRIHCDGGVYRIHPTRLVFENFADGTTNPWGVDFDDYGQCFVSNCVNPHLFHALQGGHYEPWRNRPSSLYAYERLPTCADHLHFPGDKPNAMRGETQETLAMGGGHAHCGTLVYLGDAFPPQYRNTVFMCNVHGHRINNDILKRRGSGYTASHGADFLLAGDPWFMGVTLRTGPDGSIFVSDWSDTGECHTYKPHRETGRIFKVSYGERRRSQVDLARLNDDELVQFQLHANDWYVQHARRLLQERAAKGDWNGKAVHAALQGILASRLGASRRVRALWALSVTGGLDAARLQGLLDDRDEHVRSWTIQLLCEKERPTGEVVAKFETLAAGDPSPVVRLALASALQRLPVEARWGIARGLCNHPEDAADANLPLMVWYGIEPLVPTGSQRAFGLALDAKIPLVRQFVARRFVDEIALRGEKGDLGPLVMALGTADYAGIQADLLKGAHEGLRGRKKLPMPDAWPALYKRLAQSADAVVRRDSVMLALLFGDPQAEVDLRATVQNASAPVAERQAALEALIAHSTPGLVALLHESLGDKALRRTALRGLAAFPDNTTPARVLANYAEFTAGEKQDAVATLASRNTYALALLEAVEKKIVSPADISAFAARQLFALGDNLVTMRLRKVWGDVRTTLPDKQEQIAKFKAFLTPGFLSRADTANGRQIYAKTCQQCHILYGEGGKIGPDLTGSNRANLDYILANILDPSSEISREFRMSVVAAKDGRVITGLVVESTPARLVVQTATERVTLPAEDIDEMRLSESSIMPEGQLDKLTKEEVRDLIAYLASKSQVSAPAGGPK
jgi:putative membrane-bound dehydrogenase-like protein